MSLDQYLALRNKAGCLPDLGNYSLGAAEMNPAIFERFIELLRASNLPSVIWEPFAGTSYPESSPISYAQNAAQRNGVELISYGLVPRDSRIQVKDSTVEGPGKQVGGVLFHPPYPGSLALSNHPADLSRNEDWNWTWYIERLTKTVGLIRNSMVDGGLVCAVGRDYRVYEERIRLDKLYVDLFEKDGFSLLHVWVSLPDVVLVFRWRIL